MQSAGRLNPFEFRAGLKQADTAGLIKSLSLNPFEFRAGLKPRGAAGLCGVVAVLIPLNSGLA